MVSKASEDLPEPDRPVITTRLSRGRSRSTFLRLCSRAPRTEMYLWSAMPLRRLSIIESPGRPVSNRLRLCRYSGGRVEARSRRRRIYPPLTVLGKRKEQRPNSLLTKLLGQPGRGRSRSHFSSAEHLGLTRAAGLGKLCRSPGKRPAWLVEMAESRSAR